MTDDQLHIYAVLTLGLLLPFAGLPEGVIRAASLMMRPRRSKLQLSESRLAELRPSDPSDRVEPIGRLDAIGRLEPLPGAPVDGVPREGHRTAFDATAFDALERALSDQPRREARDQRAPERPRAVTARPEAAAPDAGPVERAEAPSIRRRDDADWFYAQGDACQGPTTDRAIMHLLAQGVLGPDTLVWNESFGPSWRPICDTALIEGTVRLPPPLPGRASFVRPKLAGRAAAPAVPAKVAAPPSRPAGSKRWLMPAAVALVLLAAAAGVMVAMLQMRGNGDSEPGATAASPIVACDSTVAQLLAKRAIETAQLARILNTIVIDFSNIQQVDYDPAENKRRCRATVMHNSGTGPLEYTLTWLDETNNQVSIAVQRFPF